MAKIENLTSAPPVKRSRKLRRFPVPNMCGKLCAVDARNRHMNAKPENDYDSQREQEFIPQVLYIENSR